MVFLRHFFVCFIVVVPKAFIGYQEDKVPLEGLISNEPMDFIFGDQKSRNDEKLNGFAGWIIF